MLAFTFSDTIDAYHWFKDMPLFQNLHQQLQAELDEDTFTIAWQQGNGMTYVEISADGAALKRWRGEDQEPAVLASTGVGRSHRKTNPAIRRRAEDKVQEPADSVTAD